MESSLWDERVKKYGHTGWSDAGIYAFDQTARIRIVNALIRAFAAGKGTLLDFGCGTGEFAYSQKNNFNSILIYDNCRPVLEKAKKLIRGCTAYGNLEDLRHDSQKQDVVLSITVLQHVLDNRELKDILQVIRSKMSENSIFIVLEHFEAGGGTGSYSRSFDYDWFMNLAGECGFCEIKSWNLYQADVYSDKYYRVYSGRKDVVFWGKAYSHVPGILKKPVLCVMKTIALAGGYNRNCRKFLFPLTREAGSKFIVLKCRDARKEQRG